APGQASVREDKAGSSCVILNAVQTVLGQYGQTLEIPCNSGEVQPEDVLITKWKYGISGDLLVKKLDQNVSVLASDEYRTRVSMADNSSLLLSAAKLLDQRTFTCMIVVGSNIKEYPVNVIIYKTPSKLEITEQAGQLEIGKLTKLGTCVATEANPAANISWFRNNEPLTSGEKGVTIQTSVQVDPASGLSSTFSTLDHMTWSRLTQINMSHDSTSNQSQLDPAHYSTENIELELGSQEPVAEGDNVTLKCVADGNPAPSSFFFHLKVQQLLSVENTNTYTLTNVSRSDAGEYKCSLIDDPTLEASKSIVINYLDVSLVPSGTVEKREDEWFNYTVQIVSAEPDYSVSWYKDNVMLDTEPNFPKLSFSDAGHYECVVTMGQLTRKSSSVLQVKGAPVIRHLSKQRSEDGKHKVLVCEAEGSPKPEVFWSINGTSPEESSFTRGKVTHKLTVVPSANLTVSCTVTNEFGSDTRSINVSSCKLKDRRWTSYQSEDKDQTKLVVGVVVGLLVAILVVALVYWVYMRKSKYVNLNFRQS
uniref:Activated leukocyte cell adhesion molecule b n=1 Tax=Cynoglossus semilaevis TaxID=244447 RepID=A0A3P8WHH5_CYNSE